MRTAITILAVLGAMLVGTSVYKLHSTQVQSAALKSQKLTAKAGDILYIGNAKGQISEWSISGQKKTRDLRSPHGMLITALLVTPDSKQMVSVDQFGTMVKWDVATGNAIAPITDPKPSMNLSACTMTKDGKSVFCGGFPGSIKKYSTETNKMALDLGQCFEDLNPQSHTPQSSIWTMATTPDSKSLFVSNEFGHLKQFAVGDGSLVKDYGIVHSDSLSSQNITADGKWLFTSSISGEFKKWNIAEQKLSKDFGVIYPKGQNWIFAITSSPDSKNVFVSSSNWTLGVMSQWSVEDEKMTKDFGTVFPTHSFRAVVVSKDGKYVFAASDQGTLKQFSVGDGSLVKDYGAIGQEESLNDGIYSMSVA